MSKRILILYTGGTIGMRRTDAGYVPEPGLDRLLTGRLPPEGMPAFEVLEYERLIDSANIQPDDWQRIGTDIAARYDDFDGFVVLHGTDTMAYTASSLSFMLQGLDKPVIVTGSQIPMRELRNDAHNNLLTALLLAADYAIPEVCLYFNGHLLRGNRSTKAKAEDFDAFASPNHPMLGEVGIHISVHHDAVFRSPRPRDFQTPDYSDPQVGVVRLFPGITTGFLEAVLAQPLRGLVIQGYGVGNAPVALPGFLQALGRAADRGVVIVDVTQCQQGHVDLTQYAAGSALVQAGVVSGFDMTVEAALTKLVHLTALDLPADAVRRHMATNLAGELTPG